MPVSKCRFWTHILPLLNGIPSLCFKKKKEKKKNSKKKPKQNKTKQNKTKRKQQSS
jgi:hypothetical protein